MRLCRYNDNRLGLVEGDRVADVTAALDAIPQYIWPLPPGDLLIRHLDAVRARVADVAAGADRIAVADANFLSPVANPTKVIGAPVNYQLHIDEALEDKGLSAGNIILKIEQAGPFLKACSALVGPSEGVALRFPDRRNDHEVELAAIIGKTADRVPKEGALALCRRLRHRPGHDSARQRRPLGSQEYRQLCRARPLDRDRRRNRRSRQSRSGYPGERRDPAELQHAPPDLFRRTAD